MRLSFPNGRTSTVAQYCVMVAVSALIGMGVSWRAPGIDRYANDWLMRMRGPLAAPEDIAIVAIDEASISRYGRFPWSRSLLARAVDTIVAGQPKAIAIDVLFVDPTPAEDDGALARAVRNAGNVALAAQLVESQTSGAAEWLEPTPVIASAGAGVGHVNVLAESEGAARELLVRMADDQGRALLALPVEAVRVGDRIPPGSVVNTGRTLSLGSRSIPLEVSGAVASFGEGTAEVMRAGRMAIDYIGPTNSFASHTYSIADVLEGKMPPRTFHGHYVLIGSTAASIGERFPSPFVHDSDSRGNQHGTLMPGVEVLANALNTILRGRFYSHPSDLSIFLLACLVACATLFALGAAQGRYALIKQLLVLTVTAGFVVSLSLVAFVRFLWVAPLAPGLVTFASAGVLGLLRRSIITSSKLDRSIAQLARAGTDVIAEPAPDEAAVAIARLTGASGIVVYSETAPGRRRIAASFGAAVPLEAGPGINVEPLPSGAGYLAAVCDPSRPPSPDLWKTCAVLAEGCLAPRDLAAGKIPTVPNGLEDKAEILGRLNTRVLRQSRFVDRAMRSVEDGLLIASAGGTIRFANDGAGTILESGPGTLAGRNLFERLAESTTCSLRESEALVRLLLDRRPVEQEVATRGAKTRHFTLRIAPVQDQNGAVSGLVATLSDITRQKELQQTQKDVMSLVSHEMRTPLSAIQGMSELLAKYDVAPERRRELNTAINDEVKRLTRMITQYLDITRLESGAAQPRFAPVRLEQIVDRTLLLLEPVAAARNIQIVRSYAPGLPPVVADADLLARAADNLISNAIKYSPEGRTVTVAVQPAGGSRIEFEVADEGYGIPEQDLDRVFDKFYRVPRPQDADVPGSGLGLALVREIAELHGGTVKVISQLHTGSTFTLSLPTDRG